MTISEYKISTCKNCEEEIHQVDASWSIKGTQLLWVHKSEHVWCDSLNALAEPTEEE